MSSREVDIRPRSWEELQAGLAAVRESPSDAGTVELLCCRPDVGRRQVLEEAHLDAHSGLIGDRWKTRRDELRESDFQVQVTLMNARMIDLLAGSRDHWPLAGDQLFVDLDLSLDNLPAGLQLAVGTAVIAVTSKPHTGCPKFSQRFGAEALKFVNSPEGRQLNLRGIHARVVRSGVVRSGDRIEKLY